MEIFKSKVDIWLIVILVVVPIAVGFGAVGTFLTEDFPLSLTAFVPLVFVLGLYGLLLWPVQYEIHEKDLVIRYGVMRSRIPIDSIVRVSKSRNPLSRPALSVDRIRIDRIGANYQLISPADKAAFARALQAKNPFIHVEENVLA